MRFIAHALEELQRAGGVRQAERLALPQLMNFLELLGQTDDGYVFQPELLQFRAGDSELTLAAINQYQIRQWWRDAFQNLARRAPLAHGGGGRVCLGRH